ncbi:HNH endonuclease [Maridesulfovibrio sp.]|uniref:HNH endonuclease n=1 Tax=Maridesulfovibrio sp. TaxID=2795000 RepID=UPI0029CAA568|nr:HNH endonuclease [Maridesulfovibrio sp.]
MSIVFLGEGLKTVATKSAEVASKIPDFAKDVSFKSGTRISEEGIKVPDFNGPKEYIPRTGGEWTGEAGNSKWKPSAGDIPKKQNHGEKTWQEILDAYDIDGVEFKDGYPDFSDVAKESVEIDNFTDDRNINFLQADKKTAEKWSAENKDGKSWTSEDVRNYRKENNLTWHEHEDMQTLQLVPSEIHGNIPHSGGVAAIKNKMMEG